MYVNNLMNGMINVKKLMASIIFDMHSAEKNGQLYSYIAGKDAGKQGISKKLFLACLYI